MPPLHSKPPTWLSNAYTASHVNLALRTLAERESKRAMLRSMSVEQQPPTSSDTGLKPSFKSSSFKTNSQGNHYFVVAANSDENILSNRYIDVVPYDRTRVVVRTGGVARYLNASWVLERQGHKWWIASQAPLPTTIHTFLSLLLQPISNPPKDLIPPSNSQEGAEIAGSPFETSRIRTVVQLTRNIEGNRTKAHAYFPDEVGKSLIIKHPEPGLSTPALKVTLLQSQNHPDAQCVQSTVAITPIENTRPPSIHEDGDLAVEEQTGKNKRVIFQHLLYTAWPDHGVPEDGDRASLLAFLKLADHVNRDVSLSTYPPVSPPTNQKEYDPDPPIAVGCSAGIGRTGSFVALSSLLRHSGFLLPTANPTPASVIPPSPLGPLPEALVGDLIVEEIDSLREQRPRMVERPVQALLVYELLVDTFSKD